MWPEPSTVSDAARSDTVGKPSAVGDVAKGMWVTTVADAVAPDPPTAARYFGLATDGVADKDYLRSRWMRTWLMIVNSLRLHPIP